VGNAEKKTKSGEHRRRAEAHKGRWVNRLGTGIDEEKKIEK